MVKNFKYDFRLDEDSQKDEIASKSEVPKSDTLAGRIGAGVPKSAAKSAVSSTEYSGIKVKKGLVGQLKQPKHTGTKIRARNKGKITEQRQREKKAKRKKNLKKLGVVQVPREKGQKSAEKKHKSDENFDRLVSSYKSKITAGLKLL